MMKKLISSLALAVTFVVTGCTTVTVTKTAKGFSAPTVPADVEILGTVPNDRKYDQIGIVNANVFGTPETAYNKIREKASALGANAVFLNSQIPMGNNRTIVTGTAVRFTE
jgi:hypothetical protein